MRPVPLSLARTSRATRSCSCASPDPLSSTDDVSRRPLAFTAPLPDSVTVKLVHVDAFGADRAAAAQRQLVRAPARVTSTRIGVSVVNPPALVSDRRASRR